MHLLKLHALVPCYSEDAVSSTFTKMGAGLTFALIMSLTEHKNIWLHLCSGLENTLHICLTSNDYSHSNSWFTLDLHCGLLWESPVFCYFVNFLFTIVQNEEEWSPSRRCIRFKINILVELSVEKGPLLSAAQDTVGEMEPDSLRRREERLSDDRWKMLLDWLRKNADSELNKREITLLVVELSVTSNGDKWLAPVDRGKKGKCMTSYWEESNYYT